jgi:NADP-dependent 3-hydroxy acid dehydrogenase YdfG
MIDTNVTALAWLTHKLLPRLIARRGAIINVSSVAASYPYAGGNAYGGTDAASPAVEFRGRPVSAFARLRRPEASSISPRRTASIRSYFAGGRSMLHRPAR